MDLETILGQFKAGQLNLPETVAKLKGVESMGFARLDLSRQTRTGLAEVVYGPGKTYEQLSKIFFSFKDRCESCLATRVDEEKARHLVAQIPDLEYFPVARVLTGSWGPTPVPLGKIAVLSAGTADIPVAEEAKAVAQYLWAEVQTYYDVGVAGPHRLLHQLEQIQKAKIVIVVAGMDGALPSLVGGLIAAPIIAVPTSVGYGSAFDGLAPLLTMLNTCSAGVSVVNIDNGFGAAMNAIKILLLSLPEHEV